MTSASLDSHDETSLLTQINVCPGIKCCFALSSRMTMQQSCALYLPNTYGVVIRLLEHGNYTIHVPLCPRHTALQHR